MQRLHAVMRPTPASSTDAATAARLSATGLASSTSRKYGSLWQQFATYCQGVGLAHSPATTGTVLLYLGHLHDRGTVQPQSLQTYLSAINRYHADVLGISPGPAVGVDVTNLRHGWEQERADATASEPLDERSPLPASVAYDALRAAVFMPPLVTPANMVRYRSLLFTGLGFALMARADTDANMSATDVWLTETHVHVRLLHEKGKRRNLRRRVLELPRSIADGFLYLAVDRWSRGLARLRLLPRFAAWAASKSFWRTPYEPPFSASASALCSAWLASAVSYLGAQPPPGQKWSSHSLRKGSATAARAAGVALEKICYVGGWTVTSNVVQLYICVTVQNSAAGVSFFAWLLPVSIS